MKIKNLLLFIIILVRIIIYIHPFLYNKRVPYNISFNQKSYKGIPQIIYRTFNKRYINEKMFNDCHQKWIDLNTGFQVVWFSNKQCDNFIRNYSNKVWHAYQKLKPGAFKADLWRLCMLYKHGGIYVDAYTTPYKSIKYIIDLSNIKSKHKFISVLDCKQSGGGIHNGFIISTPKHPFMLQCINDIVHNIQTKNYTNHILGITGPICLARSIKKVSKILPKYKKYREFKKGLNYAGNLQFYLLHLEWGPFQYVCDNNIIILSKKYNTFHYFCTKFFNKSTGYSDMWKKRKVYNEHYKLQSDISLVETGATVSTKLIFRGLP